MSIRKCFIAATICSLALGDRLFSQITLEGVVTDNGKDAVRDACVKLTDQADPSRTFGDSTDASGRYSIRITPGTGVHDQGLQNPGRFQLMQNYPNPFNPSTVISFELNRPSHVRMDIFNALGRKVRTLFNGFQSDCAGRLVWDGTDDRGLGVSAGLYIYSLSAEGQRIRKKMLLLDGSQSGLNGARSPSFQSMASERIAFPKAASDTYTLMVTGIDIATCKQEGLTIKGNTVLNITVNRTVTDIDGNVYKTVKIGTQWWMAENLKTTRYRNGDVIPVVTSNSEWSALVTGVRCDYSNSADSAAIYGRLYNWYAVDDSRKIAPAGWHVPVQNEWLALMTFLGGGGFAGGKMKETGTRHWQSPNTGATNESGFTGLAGGRRYAGTGEFHDIGLQADFWSSQFSTEAMSYVAILFSNNAALSVVTGAKKYGLSVRCIKGE